MSEIFEPAETGNIPEILHEHLELAHYIEVFRSSAERVRRVIFIITVFSVVMLVAQWNITPQSWVTRRYKSFEKVYKELAASKDKLTASEIEAKTANRFSSLADMKGYIEEYRHQRIERVVLVEIPGLGVMFDINDLGNFCGLAYMLLLSVLIFSLMREHENLDLALFKVRRLHDHAAKKSDGESTANYLYHALAMSQVLSAPPTLAEWNQPAIKRGVLNALFLTPAIVQSYVVYVNLTTMPIARWYGASQWVMLSQYGLLLTNVGLGVLAILYAQACNHRWKSAFAYINPSRHFVASEPWRLWLKRPQTVPTEPMQRHLRAQAIERLEISLPATNRTLKASHVVTIATGIISYADISQMCRELEAAAGTIAKERCASYRIVGAKITSSVLNGTIWEVAGEFAVQCFP